MCLLFPCQTQSEKTGSDQLDPGGWLFLPILRTTFATLVVLVSPQQWGVCVCVWGGGGGGGGGEGVTGCMPVNIVEQCHLIASKDQSSQVYGLHSDRSYMTIDKIKTNITTYSR